MPVSRRVYLTRRSNGIYYVGHLQEGCDMPYPVRQIPA